jgi:flagellar protein FlgJ
MSAVSNDYSSFSLAAGAAGAGASAASVSSLGQAQSQAQAAKDSDFESQLRLAMDAQDEEELRDACTQFEELMLSILYKQMKATVQKSELIPADAGRETYEEWQDEQLVKEMAKNGSIGLGDFMYKQLVKRMQNAYELVEEG